MIRVLRLQTGEELVADVTDTISSEVIVSKAALIFLAPSASGQLNVQLVPFMPYVKDATFTVPRSTLVIDAEPDAGLRNHYSQMFGSGILVTEEPLVPKIQLG